MSTALGPIHYRMYNKIVAIDKLARDIASYADQQGWTSGLLVDLDLRYPRVMGQLTDHVDPSQIHSSINAMVNNAEATLAAACDPLGDHLDELCTYVRDLGRQTAEHEKVTSHLGDTSNLQAIWNAQDGFWLDGMPCDGYMRLSSTTPNSIAWSVNLEVHPAKGYEQIRSAWIAGFMAAFDLDFSSDEQGIFVINRAV